MRASLRAAGSVTLSTLSVLYRGSGWLHVESGPCHRVHAARECTGPATIVFLLESNYYNRKVRCPRSSDAE